jgi:transposase
MKELIFPPEILLQIEMIQQVEDQIDIYARSTRSEGICPGCQQVSSKVHGRYWRHPQDLPWVGLRVRLHLEVRRFACQAAGCGRKTFAEGWPAFLVA